MATASNFRYLITEEYDTFGHTITHYNAVEERHIERMPAAEIYGGYGQQWGHDGAGDWIEIKTQAGADYMNKWLAEEEIERQPYEVGDTISAYDLHSQFTAALESQLPEDLELNEVEVIGYTYWDGNNHKTLIIDGLDTEATSIETLDDEELVALLDRAIENMEKVKEGTGYKTYEYSEGDTRVVITESFWQGEWAQYTLEINPTDYTPEYY
jgi:hypothetical protein